MTASSVISKSFIKMLDRTRKKYSMLIHSMYAFSGKGREKSLVTGKRQKKITPIFKKGRMR